MNSTLVNIIKESNDRSNNAGIFEVLNRIQESDESNIAGGCSFILTIADAPSRDPEIYSTCYVGSKNIVFL